MSVPMHPVELLDWLERNEFLQPEQAAELRPVLPTFPNARILAKELVRRRGALDGDDLPGRPLSIAFWERLRDEARYDDVDALVAAIASDVERTLTVVPAEALVA